MSAERIPTYIARSMKPPFTRIILMALAFWLVAQCSRVVLEPEEVLEVLANPATSFDPLERLFYAAVTVTPPESSAVPDSVWLEMFIVTTDTTTDTAAVDTPLASLGLLDDAIQGDILPQDGVYARLFAPGVPSGTVGIARFVYYTRIGGVQYSLFDSVEVYLPVLSDTNTTMDKLANKMFASVKINLTEDDPVLDSVWVELYPASAELIDTLGSADMLLSILLEDFGDNGDILRADGIYSRLFDSPLDTGTVGLVKFLFIASVDSILHFTGDTLSLINRKPQIVAVSAADTLRLPPSGFFTLDTLRVTVSDQDGLGDLKEVSFTMLKPDSTLANNGDPFYLEDNGLLAAYGDVTAGDGIYSLIISLTSTDSRGTYEYRFTAKDLSNAVSDTAKHQVLVQ